MRVGLLECDVVRDQLRQQGFCGYPQTFREKLTRVDADIEVVDYSCFTGVLPATPGECDAYITTGARFSVLDEDDWIRSLEKFALATLDAAIPFVGICFGHQLLAQALGGRVEKAAAGWGIGISHNRIETPQWWMGDAARQQVNLVSMHQDQVVSVSPEMKVLGGSDFCPIFFTQTGDSALTIQGHPEYSRDFSRAFMEFRRDIIPADVLAAGIASNNDHLDDELVFQWIVNFMAGRR